MHQLGRLHRNLGSFVGAALVVFGTSFTVVADQVQFSNAINESTVISHMERSADTVVLTKQWAADGKFLSAAKRSLETSTLPNSIGGNGQQAWSAQKSLITLNSSDSDSECGDSEGGSDSECGGDKNDPLPNGVPEPASLVMLGMGLAGVAAGIRRRRNSRQ